MEPMNATQTHSKVRVTTSLSAPVFVAGGEISGKMELDCRTDKGLGINTMMVELVAVQELTSRDHSATSTFISSKRLFQGPGLPPSNAVYAHPQPGAPALPPNYHQARKGCTTFFFNFPIPQSSPNSINFGNGLARIFYEIRASVGVIWKGERTTVLHTDEVQITECLVDSRIPREPSTLVAEGGKMVVQAQVIGGIGVTGRPTCVELQVKNHSQKKTTGLILTLTRTLHLPNVGTSKNPFQITDTIVTVPFRGAEYTIGPGVEGVANLVFDIPRNARGVKSGPREKTDDGDHKHIEALFHVSTLITVSMAMGVSSKDIKIEVPLAILHPLAVPEPEIDPYIPPEPAYAVDYMQPLEPPRPAYGLPPSSSGPPSPGSYGTPPLQHQHTAAPPHAFPYMPSTSPLPLYGYAAPYPAQMQPYALPIVADQAYYYPPPPVQVMDYGPRPTSATPIVHQSFHDLAHFSPPVPPLPPAPAAPISVESQAIPVAVPGNTEEGKGERASRISHHLKASSRHRSVSPTAHRYRMTGPLPTPSANWGEQQAVRPSTPPNLVIPAPELHSPRPMPSPKASFAGDPIAAPGQSGRVAALERMVEEREARLVQATAAPEAAVKNRTEKSPVELDAKELNDILDKSLPKPPVPSTKPKREQAALVDIFTPNAPPAPAKEPVPVTVLANLPPRRARQSSEDLPVKHGEANAHITGKPVASGGLDALENRLLKEVGTRKPSDAVLQQLRALDDATEEDVKSKVEAKKKLAIERHVKPMNGSVDATITPSEDKEAAIHVLLNRKRRKTFDQDTLTKETEETKPANGLSSQEEEVVRLRKLAKGRVAAWLGDAHDAEPPPLSETRIIEQAAKEDVPQSDTVPASKNAVEPPPPVPAAIEKKPVDPSKIQLPGRRSSGFAPVSRMPAKAFPRVAAISAAEPKIAARYNPNPDQPVKGNYDIRSARGGRGGKVTSVAAIWADKTKADPTNPDAVSPKLRRDGIPLPAMVRLGQERIPIPAPSADDAKASEAASAKKSPTSPSPARSYPWFSAAVTPGKSTPANLVKGVSVPAKLSSSMAIPTLSSTESLARPQGAERKTVGPLKSNTATQKPANDSSTKPVSPLNASTSEPRLASAPVSFGQARLKGLIAKYQGAT